MAFNGETKIDAWDDDKCNEIVGTDGSLFPPASLQHRNQSLNVYIKDMCRPFPLEYVDDVNVSEGVTAWRYVAAPGVFASSTAQGGNKCYCVDDVCPPDGVFDASKCMNDAVVYVSFPHFYTGDAKLFEKFEGLHPNAQEHMTYADMHPKVPFPIGGASRFQINARVRKSNRVKSGIVAFVWLALNWFYLKKFFFYIFRSQVFR